MFNYQEMIKRKKPWTHSQQCDYCKDMEFPPEKHGNHSGCRHFRGGKTITKRSK